MSAQKEGRSQRLIGGVFGLPDQTAGPGLNIGKTWPFGRTGTLRLADARSAFFVLGQTLRPKKVWLPSYLCTAVVQGFQAASVPIEFFPINDHLSCEDSGWLERVQRGDLVVRINYFGFLNRDSAFAEAIGRGARVIDDAAQAFLTEGIGNASHYAIYSPRKFVGVPDGGFLVSLTDTPIGWPALRPSPPVWWEEALQACALRREYDAGATGRDWFLKFQNSERSAPTGLFAMSEFSSGLLDRGFDFSAIAQTRRANYLELLAHLHDFALFPGLSDGIVPVGFPVRHRDRDSVRQALIREDIFPPIHWDLREFIPGSFTASHALARETMTLPCDQRYDADDMRRISEVFLRTCAKMTSIPSSKSSHRALDHQTQEK
jgi:hypothetical protein